MLMTIYAMKAEYSDAESLLVEYTLNPVSIYSVFK